MNTLIGEQSEPPPDKLGGEVVIALLVLVCVSLYIYVTHFGKTILNALKQLLRYS